MFDLSSESEGKPLAIKDELQLEEGQTADFAVLVRRDVDYTGYSEWFWTHCEPLEGMEGGRERGERGRRRERRREEGREKKGGREGGRERQSLIHKRGKRGKREKSLTGR